MVRGFVEWIGKRLSVKAPDRRRAGRRDCSIAARWQAGTAAHEARVLDIGHRGLRLESGEPLKNNGYGKVATAREPGKGVPCRVVWCERHGDRWLAGLTFVASRKDFGESWVPEELDSCFSPYAAREKRAARRQAVSLPVELCDSAGTRLGPATMTDFSVSGTGLCTRASLSSGQRVKLRFKGNARNPGRELEAVVRNWHRCEGSVRGGLEFRGQDTGRTNYLKSVARALC